MQNSSVSLLLVYYLTQQLKPLTMAVFDIKNNSKIKTLLSPLAQNTTFICMCAEVCAKK